MGRERDWKGLPFFFDDGSGFTETDSQGYWSKRGLQGTVTVTPDKEGWMFEPPARECSEARSDLDFLATLKPDTFELEVMLEGMGTVTIEGYGVVEPPGTILQYEEETLIEVTAHPETGWEFLEWEGVLGDIHDSQGFVYVQQDQLLKATFQLLEPHIRVPHDYSSIQEALDHAEDGSVIEVVQGIYQERINFNGKNVLLRSTDPYDEEIVKTTIIDGAPQSEGEAGGTVITFNSGESNRAVVTGFTIRGGVTTEHGLGIYINGANPSIINNRIIQNQAQERGGGIYAWMPATETYNFGVIKDNYIAFNVADIGGGICYGRGGIDIKNNHITGNEGNLGGGISVIFQGHPTIRDNVIDNNLSSRGGGIAVEGDRYTAPTISNNEIRGNESQGSDGGGIYIRNASAVVTDNIIEDNRSNQHGGGVYARTQPSQFTSLLEDNIIKDNSAARQGGGVTGIQASLVRDIVENNRAEEGGGLYVTGDPSGMMTPEIEYNTFSGNIAEERGDGIVIILLNPIFHDTVITGNKALNGDGGGLCIVFS